MPDRVRKLVLCVMLDYQPTVPRQQSLVGTAHFRQYDRVVKFVGRIEKDNVPGLWMTASGKCLGGRTNDLGVAFGDRKPIQVLFDERTRPSRPVNESNKSRTSRQSFNADRTRSGTQVKKPCIRGQNRRDDIEKRLSKAVGCRAGSVV